MNFMPLFHHYQGHVIGRHSPSPTVAPFHPCSWRLVNPTKKIGHPRSPQTHPRSPVGGSSNLFPTKPRVWFPCAKYPGPWHGLALKRHGGNSKWTSKRLKDDETSKKRTRQNKSGFLPFIFSSNTQIINPGIPTDLETKKLLVVISITQMDQISRKRKLRNGPIFLEKIIGNKSRK